MACFEGNVGLGFRWDLRCRVQGNVGKVYCSGLGRVGGSRAYKGLREFGGLGLGLLGAQGVLWRLGSFGILAFGIG